MSHLISDLFPETGCEHPAIVRPPSMPLASRHQEQQYFRHAKYTYCRQSAYDPAVA